jgi:hypothetical protein
MLACASRCSSDSRPPERPGPLSLQRRLRRFGNLVRVMQSLALGPQVAFLEAADPAANRQGVPRSGPHAHNQTSAPRVMQLWAPPRNAPAEKEASFGRAQRVAAQAAAGGGTAVTAGFESPPSILEAVAGNHRAKHWACYAHFQAGWPLTAFTARLREPRS